MMGTIAIALDWMCRGIQPAAFYPLLKLREAIEKHKRKKVPSLKTNFGSVMRCGVVLYKMSPNTKYLDRVPA